MNNTFLRARKHWPKTLGPCFLRRAPPIINYLFISTTVQSIKFSNAQLRWLEPHTKTQETKRLSQIETHIIETWFTASTRRFSIGAAQQSRGPEKLFHAHRAQLAWGRLSSPKRDQRRRSKAGCARRDQNSNQCHHQSIRRLLRWESQRTERTQRLVRCCWQIKLSSKPHPLM